MLIPIFAVSGCAQMREIPVTDLRPWKPIKASCADTQETRDQVRAHNSVLDSLKSGKKVVYRDDCKQEAKPTS